MTAMQETSVSKKIIDALRGIKKPTVRQQLIIDELMQTSTPELGPELAKELAETTKEAPGPDDQK